MVFLHLGTALSWEETKEYADHVRYSGITQFLNIWNRLKDRQGDKLLWGDEIEYSMISLDKDEKKAKLALRQTEVLEKLGSLMSTISAGCPDQIPIASFQPEFGRQMLESIPGSPYTGSITDLLSVEHNMRYRRTLIRSQLEPNELPITLTTFPRLGVPGAFTEPYFDPSSAISSHSLFLPQELQHPHARFHALTGNIRIRRGSKVAVNLPMFPDKNVPHPFIDPTIPWDRDVYPEDSDAKNGAALPNHIYLDAKAFGGSCCCLQVTIQGCNVDQVRRLYDAMVPLGPIMLALTAASPAWRGYLADVDCRWNAIAEGIDDRTEEERGLKPLKNERRRIPKSRYDSVDMYISNNWINLPEYNDIYVPIDEDIYKRLRDAGLDDLLSKHMSHLFIRDPLVVFSDAIDQDDSISNDHFEDIQSTNWQSVRFKPPPPNSNIGWRVEFRTMEVQMTDFENAAFSIFMILLTRTVLAFNLNFYIPISKVDENMQRAQLRDACRSKTFFFRKNVFPPGQTAPISPIPSACSLSACSDCASVKSGKGKMRNCFSELPRPVNGVSRGSVEDEYEEMSMEEIMNGKSNAFPGILGLINVYVDSLEVDAEERQKIGKYLDFIKQRSNGSLQTPATWMRNFIRSHPKYKFDSVVSQEINYDLVVAVDEIERGIRREPGLLPKDYNVDTNDDVSIGL